MSALEYPEQVGEPPVVTPPDVLPGRLVNIPDPNLRSLLEETLGTKTIRPDVMATLTTLKASGKDISDLTGLEFAVNLEELWLSKNPVSDLSPLAGCTNLIRLFLWDARVEDLSPLANLTRLEVLEHRGGSISDISPLAGLTNLRVLWFYNADVSDISAVSGMTKLEKLGIRHTNIEDFTPLSGLINLEELNLDDSDISDLSPLRNLTNLRNAELSGNRISDLSPLTGLTNLVHLKLRDNNIYDFSPITELRRNLTIFVWHGNPGYPTQQGAMIEGIWLWLYIPGTTLDSTGIDTDFLSRASGGAVTEIGIATSGATSGNPVGKQVWTSHKLPTTGEDNIKDMLGDRMGLERTELQGVVYGNILLYAPREQNTMIHFSTFQRTKVWLNGTLMYRRDSLSPDSKDIPEFVNVTLQQGINVLLIASDLHRTEPSYGFFGFMPDTEYTVENPSTGFAFSETPIRVGETFILDIRAENVFNLAGWQFNLAFDPAILEAVGVSEGDFLKSDGGTTFFQSGRIDNAAGKITGLIAGRISDGGASGSGSLLQVEFKAESEGETKLALEDFELGSITGENIPASPLEIRITVAERLVTGDVNRDGRVSILDLILVAQQLGSRVPPNSAVDINGDGMVNIFDLTLVAQGIAGAAAPAATTGRADATTVEAWIAEARLVDDGSIAFLQGITNLENLLASLIVPQETALHANYPNPFNPETWIPYQLAAPAEVSLTIYDMSGGVVRRLEMGHQTSGMYRNRSRAAHWDGRNWDGESVASGLYFYTLKAGEFTGTRKMLIRK